jgi:hypothetical protein
MPKKRRKNNSWRSNAKIGREEVNRPIIGKYRLHTVSNDNGIRLIDFASSKNNLVASTLYNH